MDSRTREILETIEAFRKQGVKKLNPKTGAEYSAVKFPLPGFNKPLEIAIPAQNFRQPSVECEKRWGLRGISGNYRMPEGLTHADLETYALLLAYSGAMPEAARTQKLARAWALLEDVNPVLKEIRADRRDGDSLHFMLNGVASAFSVSDIQYFIDHQDKEPARLMWQSETYIFNKAAKPDESRELQWAASPRTLRKITRQMERKLG
jgi:hypothetical protein